MTKEEKSIVKGSYVQFALNYQGCQFYEKSTNTLLDKWEVWHLLKIGVIDERDLNLNLCNNIKWRVKDGWRGDTGVMDELKYSQHTPKQQSKSIKAPAIRDRFSTHI